MIERFSHTCYKCSDSGWLNAISREGKLSYVFQCSYCTASKLRGLSKSIPFWKESLKDKYEPLGEYNARKGWLDDRAREDGACIKA